MLIIGKFIHEGEKKADPQGIPNVEENIFVFLRLEEGNAMDFELPQCSVIKFMQQVMQMSAQFFIEAREKLGDLLLRYGWGKINIPYGQTGKRLRIA